jgi:hypothetical protein
MRITDLLLESKSPLLEGEMTNAQWMKSKYVTNLLDGLDNGQPYSFEFPAGSRFTGIIQNPEQVKTAVNSAVQGWDQKKFAASKIKFSVAVIDQDTGEPTGEVVDNVPINSMFKDEKIKGELVPNMGNVSEALLGCAVAAKFASGGAQITEKQLMEMGRQLARNQGYIETAAGKDKLVFKVTIPFLDRKAFYAWLGEDSRGRTLQDYKVPSASIALIERRAKVAVEYANTSKRVAGAVQQAQEDPRQNKVDVLSDGGEKENQSSTKVDLKILIDGKETAKRLLSVKAGKVAQFGQVTGANFEHASEFFSAVGVTVPETLRKYFYDIPAGTRGAAAEKQHNFENGIAMVFQNAFKQLKARAASDQVGLVEDVYQGLLQHLTRKEEGVEMVILDPDDKKAFRELSFGPEFRQALSQLQLVVTESDREKGYNISIYGFPIGSIAKKYVPGRKDADSKLVDLTSQSKDNSIRNMLGMGSLLKHIADIENYIEKQGSQAPVAKTAPKVVPTTKSKPASNVVAPERTPAPAPQAMPPTPDELDQIKRNAGIKKTANV